MLSVVITAFNEEDNLPRVLNSVKNLADEIVLVDTESTDRTVEIAKNFGCRIFTHKKPGIVEPVRNFSISKAGGDWILLLDADEEVPPELALYIKQCIKSGQAEYYRIPRKNIIFGSWIKSSHWWPDFVYRLFKKGYVVWGSSIHSVPQTRGTGMEIPAQEKYALVHHNYQTVSQYLERLNRYTDRQLEELIDKQIKFSWHLLITKPYDEFISQYFSRNGYKEGIHGLVLSGLQAFSEFILYIKYWQYQKFTEAEVTLNDFSRQINTKAAQYQWWKYDRQISSASLIGRLFLKIRKNISVFLSGHI